MALSAHIGLDVLSCWGATLESFFMSQKTLCFIFPLGLMYRSIYRLLSIAILHEV